MKCSLLKFIITITRVVRVTYLYLVYPADIIPTKGTVFISCLSSRYDTKGSPCLSCLYETKNSFYIGG